MPALLQVNMWRLPRLSGTLPSVFGNGTDSAIYHVSLHDNSLSGTFPANIGEMSLLWQLNMFDNRLSGAWLGSARLSHQYVYT